MIDLFSIKILGNNIDVIIFIKRVFSLIDNYKKINLTSSQDFFKVNQYINFLI